MSHFDLVGEFLSEFDGFDYIEVDNPETAIPVCRVCHRHMVWVGSENEGSWVCRCANTARRRKLALRKLAEIEV